MSAAVTTISQAIATTLTGATLSQSITVTRAYVLPRDLSAITGIEVHVIPSLLALATADLGQRQSFDWTVSVWVHKRLATTDITEIDGLMLLVEEIARLFAAKRLTGIQARCVGAENRPAADPDALDSKTLFSSQLLLTFRMTL